MRQEVDPAAFRLQTVARDALAAEGPFADQSAEMNLAGVGSVLKVYNGILQQKPDARWKPLDDLLKKQTQGKLDDFVRKTCGTG